VDEREYVFIEEGLFYLRGEEVDDVVKFFV